MRNLIIPLFAAVACARPTSPPTAAEAPVVPVEQPAGVPADEAPPKPGLNDNFLDPELDVDAWVERFGAESREVVASQAAILAAIGLAPGQSIADIGAGTGLYLSPFADAVGASGTVFAVDISPRFLEHLGAMASDAGLSQVQTVQASATSSNLPEASVDAAFICDTYHHFEQPADTLSSLFAAVKPGGRLYVIDFIREEGVSSEWILGHVRAGQEVFAAEIEAAGFSDRQVLEVGLSENYMLAFTRPE